ncbi:MAG TPA: hypothetical protein VMB22_03875, partial [Verrucomicrobiae bacterium]|nr:hypothetical protein [Verrucomicrobiae bacterium]
TEFTFRNLDRFLADALGELVFVPARSSRCDFGFIEKDSPTTKQMALVAAVILVQLAACFRDSDCGFRLDRDNAVSVCRLHRLLFSRRIFFWEQARAESSADWNFGGIHALPHSRH